MCSAKSFSLLAWRLASADSLCSRVSLHSGCSSRLPGLIGKKSLMALPKITWAGLSPVSLSGVFLWRRSAQRNLSVFKLPSAAILSLSILLADLTPCSALWENMSKTFND